MNSNIRFSQTLVFRNLFVVLLTSILYVPTVAWSAFKISLSDTHIQSTLVRHFPIREYAAFARVTLHEPQVILSRDSKELLLIIPVDANIPDQDQKKGHVRIALKIVYRPGNGGLYLNNPHMVEFEMPGLPKILATKLKEKITTICLNSLPLIQIFRLKETLLNHSLAKSALKSYSIKDGSISLVFGFD